MTHSSADIELDIDIGDIGEVSDSYHTFNQLYDHRNLLFLNLTAANPALSFKTWLNDEKERMEGWFILGMNTERGQITYHLPERLWDLAAVKEVEYNFDYDGHSSDDVLERLIMFNRHVSFGELLPNQTTLLGLTQDCEAEVACANLVIQTLEKYGVK